MGIGGNGERGKGAAHTGAGNRRRKSRIEGSDAGFRSLIEINLFRVQGRRGRSDHGSG